MGWQESPRCKEPLRLTLTGLQVGSWTLDVGRSADSPLRLTFSDACPSSRDMVTISQNDVAPLPTPSRCVPHSSGFPVQMRHGDGCLGVRDVDGADRFVG